MYKISNSAQLVGYFSKRKQDQIFGSTGPSSGSEKLIQEIILCSTVP